jgi:hypothetical protein
MTLRSLYAIGLVGVATLQPALSAQSSDDRLRIHVRDHAVARIHLSHRDTAVVVQPSSSDPCRDRGWDDSSYRHCEVREETMPGGPLTVDAGRNGGIQVEGWDRSDIRIVAVVTAHARSESDARQIASGIQVQAGGGRVSSTGPESAGREGWSVSYRISVPRRNDLELKANNGGVSIAGVSGTIRFETRNGGVKLTDLAGDVRGETHNGGLSVALGGSQWEGTGLDVETTNGGVTLSIPDGYNADLTTRTSNGGFRSELPITVQGELTARRGLQTTLGSGGPPVNVRTSNGGFRINRR